MKRSVRIEYSRSAIEHLAQIQTEVADQFGDAVLKEVRKKFDAAEKAVASFPSLWPVCGKGSKYRKMIIGGQNVLIYRYSRISADEEVIKIIAIFSAGQGVDYSNIDLD